MDRTRSEGRNLAAAFADELTQILGGVTGPWRSSPIACAPRMEVFDMHASAREIPLLSNATIQAAIIGPEGRLLSTRWTPRRSRSTSATASISASISMAGFRGSSSASRWRARLAPDHDQRDAARIRSGSPRQHRSDRAGRHCASRFTREDPHGLAGIGQRVGHPWAAAIPANGEGTFIKESVIDHITRLFSYRRVGDYPLVVTVGSDVAKALAASREHARVIAAIAGLATILLTGLAVYLIREIRQRTSHEIALADERDKLQAASDCLKADIALRKEVEEKLREIQATLRDAVDSISEGFVIYDRNDCFVMCNEPYRRLYLKAAHLMVQGTPFEEIVWAGLDAGWYADAVGYELEWLANRIAPAAAISFAFGSPIPVVAWMPKPRIDIRALLYNKNCWRGHQARTLRRPRHHRRP